MGGERTAPRRSSLRSLPLNYDHAFHAGNFADLMKHAILIQLLERLTAPGSGPLTVLDTHAGSGRYDLQGPAARRSGEAEHGVRRLMQAPAPPAGFAPLVAALWAANPDGSARYYPGSPAVMLGRLRSGDRYVGCELGGNVHADLTRAVAPIARARGVAATVLHGDGYAQVAPLAQSGARALVFVDPPFERADDYARIVQVAAALQGRPNACVAVWTPLKDLETFDALLRELETLALSDIVVAQVRLRPLSDPMRMNGCAMILISAPDVAGAARAICAWTASTLGEPGGEGRVFTP